MLFLITSYGAVMYAQGYKYDFEEGRFFRTGAISLDSNTSAKLYIDGKEKDSTSLISNGLGIDGLLPGRHDILVQRDGHFPWTKSVNIEEGSVLHFPGIYLFPNISPGLEDVKNEIEREFSEDKGGINNKAFSFKDGNLYFFNDDSYTLVASGVKGVSISEDNKKLAWWTRNEVYLLWLDNASSQPFQSKGTLNFVTRLGSTIENITWFKGEDYLVIKSDGRYRIIEIDTRGGANIVNI